MLQYQTFIDVIFLLLSLATFLQLDLIVFPLNIAQSKAKESLKPDEKTDKNHWNKHDHLLPFKDYIYLYLGGNLVIHF